MCSRGVPSTIRERLSWPADRISVQPIIDFLSKYRQPLARTVLGVGCVLAAVTVAIAVLRYSGNWVAQRFLIFYMAPLFLFGAAWARKELRAIAETSPPVLVVNALVFV